jgi:hypothetical protein
MGLMKQKLIDQAGRDFENPSGNVYSYQKTNEPSEMGGFSVFDQDCLIYDLDTHRRLHPCSVKLFGAYSLDIDPKYGEYRIYWFYANSKEPLAPYEDLIYGYEPKCHSEWAIDESFTKDEIELLREYLAKAHNSELHVQEVDLPIPNNILGYGEIFGYWDINGEQIEGQIELSRDEGYSLPFEVSGYYNLQDRA